MTLTLGAVAAILGVSPLPRDVSERKIFGWSVDTRTLQPGDLFFALRGPIHDGHDHVPAAFRAGAAGAVVECHSSDEAALLVPDTLLALQNLARCARSRWGGKVVAVTGSAGKTTTKDAIAHLLEEKFQTGKNEGNLNNHVGVPLSILRLPENSEIAVLEMGMNHAGEIRALAGIARPDVGVVTNVGYAHVEFFDSIDGVAAAKRELIESLSPDGVAVLNADDERVLEFRKVHRGRTITFGFSPDADVRAEALELGAEITRFRIAGTAFETSLAGRHGVLNLLAAVAVARVFDIPPERLRERVRSFSAGKMRGERIERGGVTIWNDCYNSNPEAVRGMLDVLRETPARRRIAVLGEMLELGLSAEALHRDVGSYVASRGIDVLVGIRGAARAMVTEAMRAGLSDGAAHFFEDPTEAGDFVRQLVRPGDALLFKGSRGVHVERALERLLS